MRKIKCHICKKLVDKKTLAINYSYAKVCERCHL